jgi:hypothetical protein
MIRNTTAGHKKIFREQWQQTGIIQSRLQPHVAIAAWGAAL